MAGQSAGSSHTQTGADASIGFRAIGPARFLAMLGTVGLLASFVGELYHITDVVGGVPWLVAFVVGALVLATGSSRFLSTSTAIALSVLGLVIGIVVYLTVVPQVYFSVLTIDRIVTDVLALLTGLSILQIVEADIWAISVAPAPVFLTWYLMLRQQYDRSALIGGLALGFFVLTGDASQTTSLLGMTSMLGLLGFGALDNAGWSWRQAQNLSLVLIGAVLFSRFVSIVPNSDSDPLGGGLETPTIEGSLVSAGDRIPILGSISLSPEVRFTVTADREAYWHAGAYNRYTGSGWLRSGEADAFTGSLSGPRGDATAVQQEFRAEASVQTMPAAWKPVRLLESPSQPIQVTSTGNFQPTQPFSEGDGYVVESAVLSWTAEQLRGTEQSYPDVVREQYTQLPASTPDRIGELTARLTANAENPYDTARIIERWLKNNKRYSLDIRKPSGDIASAFLFEMDAGYCTYFATTMVVMLRTQGIPARFTVGYTPGEQINDDTWVVRGFDSHAWVEVYFQDVGWVLFDPTPAGPRRQAEQSRLDNARAMNVSNVDTAETEPTPTESEPTPTTSKSTLDENASNTNSSMAGSQREGLLSTPERSGERRAAAENFPVTPEGSTSDPAISFIRERDRLSLLAGAAGVVLGAYRLGLIKRGYQALWIRHHPRTGDPNIDVIRAFNRLETLLANQYRERKSDETVRDYLDALDTAGVDQRVHRIAAIYERARYAGRVSSQDAETAIELMGELAKKHGLLP